MNRSFVLVFLVLMVVFFGINLPFSYFQLQNQVIPSTIEDKHGQTVGEHRRLKRQAIPSDNIQIYAASSNVSISDRVQVLSLESRIQLSENYFNATFWSNASLITFGLNETAEGKSEELVSLSASNFVAFDVQMNGAVLEGIGDTVQLNASTYRNSSNISYQNTNFAVQLTGENVNFSFADEQSTRIVSKNGKFVFIRGQTWTNASIKPHLRIVSALSNISQSLWRKLSISARSHNYDAEMSVEGNELYLNYAGVLLNVSADHSSVLLRTKDGRRRVLLYTTNSPFEIVVEDGKLQINCFNENTVLEIPTMMGENALLILTAEQLTRLFANRSSSSSVSGVTSLSVNGASAQIIDNLELVARQLRLYMNIDQIANATAEAQSLIFVDTVHSKLRIRHSNISSVGGSQNPPPMITATMIAERHLLEMLGGDPRVVIQVGNVTFVTELSENGSTEYIPNLNATILPAELIATKSNEDYLMIGPEVVNFTDQKMTLGRTPVWFSLEEWSKLSSEHGKNFVTFESGLLLRNEGFTPQMIPADKLFSFHQTPIQQSTSTTVSQLTSASEEDTYPTPEESMFTFQPTQAEKDFIVAHFELTTPSNNSASEVLSSHNPEILSSSMSMFPLSATIDSIQVPETNLSTDTDGKENEFRGVDRENRFQEQQEQQSSTEQHQQQSTTVTTTTTTKTISSDSATTTTKSRESREILSAKRQHKDKNLVELNFKVDQSTSKEETFGKDGLSPSVRFKVDLERTLNDIIRVLLGKELAKQKHESVKRTVRALVKASEEDEIVRSILDDNASEGTDNSSFSVHIRQLEDISSSSSPSPEKIYRLRFDVDNDENETEQNLTELIVMELNKMGLEELSRRLHLRVLSAARLYYDPVAERLLQRNFYDWSFESRLAGSMIFICTITIALIWVFISPKRRSFLTTLLRRRRSSSVSSAQGMVSGVN